MIDTHLILILLTITCSVSGIRGVTKDLNPYCFQFTWLARTTHQSVNCTAIPHAPCVEPFVFALDDTPPNVTYIWENLDRTKFRCPLASGFACLKYSYTYNDAVLNTTYFCGKMIEDKTLAITNGCFSQKTSGHIIEACACRSEGGMMPCNSSISTHSPKYTIVVVAFLFILVCDYSFENEFFSYVKKLLPRS